jgi:hypothetical protein
MEKQARKERAQKVMRAAWAIRKAAAAKYSVKVSEILFSPCLVQAWQESKMPNFIFELDYEEIQKENALQKIEGLTIHQGDRAKNRRISGMRIEAYLSPLFATGKIPEGFQKFELKVVRPNGLVDKSSWAIGLRQEVIEKITNA